MREREIVYLGPRNKFPELRNRHDSGVIAFGGDLSIKRLLEAYTKGIFPWYGEDSPILWHSPNQRCIFEIDGLRVSHSLRQKLRKNIYTFTFDLYFKQIMEFCALIKREGEVGTWIFKETVDAYTAFHKAGYAHSLEVWKDNHLVGGMFGVSLGRAFFGESMFHIETDASKIGLYFLFQFLKQNNFHFVDAQMHTDHLISLGAVLLPREEYLDRLDNALQFDTIRGNWNEYVTKYGTPAFYGRSYKDVRTQSE